MCGLFGVIYKQPQPLDKVAFISLGRDNVSRGKDSCGIVIDNMVEYGIDKTKEFESFYKTSKLLKNTTKCKFAIGHTRAASTGLKIGLDQAQPITIYEGNKLQYVLTHNGTIDNKAKDLAKKYIPHIEVGDNTDSWIMAHIFYYVGYDVLQEYDGSGMFIMIDYRKEQPQVMMFKGASKKTYADQTLYEERPLYVVTEENAIWYSSMSSSLEAARYGNDIKQLLCNTLYLINDNLKFQVIKRYDRSHKIQASNTWYGYNTKDYSNGFGTSSYSNNDTKSYTINHPGMIENKQTNTYTEKVNYGPNGLYTFKGKVLNEIMKLDFGGFTVSQYSVTGEEFPFYAGRLLMDIKDFELIKEIEKELNLKENEFEMFYPELLDYLSYLPMAYVDENKNQMFLKQYDLEKLEYYEGKLRPLFHIGITYKVEKGYIISKKEYESGALDRYKEARNAWNNIVDRTVLKQEFIKFIADANK